jgi:hypothetical protein
MFLDHDSLRKSQPKKYEKTFSYGRHNQKTKKNIYMVYSFDYLLLSKKKFFVFDYVRESWPKNLID